MQRQAPRAQLLRLFEEERANAMLLVGGINKYLIQVVFFDQYQDKADDTTASPGHPYCPSGGQVVPETLPPRAQGIRMAQIGKGVMPCAIPQRDHVADVVRL